MSILSCPVEDVSHSPGVLRRGMCDKHYRRSLKHGDPMMCNKRGPNTPPALHPKECVGCGVAFDGYVVQKFCTKQCGWRVKAREQYKRDSASGKALERHRRRNKYADWATFVAAVASPPCSIDGCERPYIAKGFCVPHYRKEFKIWDDGKSHRQRAKKHGTPHESVNRTRVFERDGWMCGICGVEVDREAKFPAPLSPSLDHVIPISRGGGHLYSNVQLAHLSCNVKKGATMALEVANV